MIIAQAMIGSISWNPNDNDISITTHSSFQCTGTQCPPAINPWSNTKHVVDSCNKPERPDFKCSSRNKSKLLFIGWNTSSCKLLRAEKVL
jgi:hypothetical protein